MTRLRACDTVRLVDGLDSSNLGLERKWTYVPPDALITKLSFVVLEITEGLDGKEQAVLSLHNCHAGSLPVAWLQLENFPMR